MKTTYRIIYYLLSTLLLTSTISCATMGKSIVLGTAIGGATVGAIGSRNGNTQAGAALGALVGAGLSYLIFKQKEKKESTTPSSLKLELDEADAPFLKSPKVRKYWQDDKIEGKKFIKGHWIYEIQEVPVWMQP